MVATTLSITKLSIKELYDTQHNNVLPLCWRRFLFIVMLSYIMRNVAMLSIVAPFNGYYCQNKIFFFSVRLRE
jgi:hypothetical protein